MQFFYFKVALACFYFSVYGPQWNPGLKRVTHAFWVTNASLSLSSCSYQKDCSFFFLFLFLPTQLDILCNEEILGKDHTLKFVVVTRWRFKVTSLWHSWLHLGLQWRLSQLNPYLHTTSITLLLHFVESDAGWRMNRISINFNEEHVLTLFFCLFPEIAPPAPLQTQNGSLVAQMDTQFPFFLF